VRHTRYFNRSESGRHYQEVAIFRNKVKDPLAQFYRNATRYADKTPSHVTQHELSVLRQGYLPRLKYYDNVEKRPSHQQNHNDSR